MWVHIILFSTVLSMSSSTALLLGPKYHAYDSCKENIESLLEKCEPSYHELIPGLFMGISVESSW